MAVSIPEIVELLRREYLFQGMGDDQLNWIADKFHPLNLERNTVVYSEGAPGDCFYMVFNGRVRVIRRINRQDQLLNILIPGDFFGEEALLFNAPRTSTIRTIEKTTLLRMDRERFDMMLDAYPEIRTNLMATAESRRLANTKRFDWLNEEEVVYFITRKHDFFLLLSLIVPIIIGILSVPVFSFALFEIDVRALFWVGIGFGVLLLLIAMGLAVWNFIDWGNDYYIVTSQRVVWSEKMLALYDSRREAPLDTILAVNVTTSQLGRILKYGNVNVRTFTGGILMKHLNHPYRFASFVEGYKRRAVEISKEEEARAIDQALAQALTKSQLLAEGRAPEVPQEPPPFATQEQRRMGQQPKMGFSEWLGNIFKVRFIQGSIITYRKHWFILLRRAWKPALLLAILIGILIGAPVAQAVWDVSMLPPLIRNLLAFLVLPGVFLWFVYDYLDWSNDIYRLTPEQIFDIERKPFGQESKKTAPLESILSIEHERANLIGIMLNFGNVTINVGQTKFDFIGVYNPDQVHQDIADYREALNRRKRAKEAERERERMVNWLVTFYNQTLADVEDFPGEERI